MSSFTATGNASGQAYTSTTPAYLVTSTATATASSTLSQNNAQEIASLTAQQVANSVAENDANIVSQTLDLSPAGVIGQYSYLNLSFSLKIPINGQGEFNGLIKDVVIDELSNNSKALTITSNKVVYNSVTFQPIPDTVQLTTINAVCNNYGGPYGDKIVNGETFSSPTAKSLFTSNRLSSTSIPVIINKILYTYKIKIITNIRYYVNEPIIDTTLYTDLNNNIYGIKINSKVLSNVHVINENDKTTTTFTGVTMTETFSSDNNFNTITLDFSKAFASLVTQNVYPYEINAF